MPKTKSGTLQYSDEELDRQFAEATKRGQKAALSEPHAQNVAYDPGSNRIVLDLDNGTSFSFQTRLVKELADATQDEINDVSIAGRGNALRWNALDLDLGVVELIAGIYGTQRWMATLAQKGGRVKSAAKAAAARENGKKGGRPRIRPRIYLASSSKDGFEAELIAARNMIPDVVVPRIEQDRSVSPITLDRLGRDLREAEREWRASISKDISQAKLVVKVEQATYESVSECAHATTVGPLQTPSCMETNNAELSLAA